MQKIGRTDDGEFIVTMSTEEMRALSRLAKAEAGWTHISLIGPRLEDLDYDLSRALDRVWAYTDSLVAVNQVQDQVNLVRRALEKRKL